MENTKAVLDCTCFTRNEMFVLCKMRDRHVCQINKLYPLISKCDNKLIDVHHIKQQSVGGDDSLDNLISLCVEHHRMVHGKGEKATKLNRILREYGISQTEMAGAMGMTQSAISQKVSSDNPSIRDCRDILDFVNAVSCQDFKLEDLF